MRRHKALGRRVLLSFNQLSSLRGAANSAFAVSAIDAPQAQLPITQLLAPEVRQAGQRLPHVGGLPRPTGTWQLAAVIAAGVGLATAEYALCDAPPQDAGRWLEQAAQVLQDVWSEIEEDVARTDAARSTAQSGSPPKAPEYRLVNGKLSIKVPIREGVDPARLMDVVMRALRLRNAGPGQSHFYIINRGGNRFQLESTRDGDAPLQIRMSEPRPGDSTPAVEFVKAGPLSQADLEVIKTALRAANDIGVNKGLFAGDELLNHLDSLIKPFFPGHPDLLKDMQEMSEQFRRLFDLQDLQGMGDLGPPSEPLPGPVEDEFPGLPGPPQEQPRDTPLGMVGTGGASAQLMEFPPEHRAVVKKLQKLGCMVYPPKGQEHVDWGLLAGYEEQKRQIEDTLLLALLHPEVYNEIARKTRQQYADNRPRGVLFEGPPGCGKTTSARVIARQASVPLVYVPLEALASKWYGESEKRLSDVFASAEALDGCIVFLDEVDALATTRGSEMHEATRRLLGVLLRQLDGFEQNKNSVVIAATNRKQDLDPALLSRFDATIQFGLPDDKTRKEIIKAYAKHLSDEDLSTLAELTVGMSGRDLRDICEQAERRWAAKIIRGQVSAEQLPPADLYRECAAQRQQERITIAEQLPLRRLLRSRME